MKFLLRLQKLIFNFLCSMGCHDWEPVPGALRVGIGSENYHLVECRHCRKGQYTSYPNKAIR